MGELRCLPHESETKSLSVIIPVFNAGPVLHDCLSALRTSSILPGELILVDDFSDQPLTRPKINEFPVSVLRTPRPSGAGEARNLGSRHAKGDILLFIDSDVVISSLVIARVL